MKLPTIRENFVKIVQRVCRCDALVFHKLVKFSVWGPHTPPLHQWGDIWREEVHVRYHPIGSVRHPVGQKHSKSPPTKLNTLHMLQALRCAGNNKFVSVCDMQLHSSHKH